MRFWQQITCSFKPLVSGSRANKHRLRHVMANFLVIVSCAAATATAQCPIKKPLHSVVAAVSKRDCETRATDLITKFGYKPQAFRIICHPTKSDLK